MRTAFMVMVSAVTLALQGLSLHAQPMKATGTPSAWNEFRGPNGAGTALHGNPPVTIDPKQASWSITVPPGYSSPVLSERSIFLTGVVDHRLMTMAFRKDTGRSLWRRPAPQVPMERVHASSHPATSTPYLDGDRLYVYFGSYGLICYDLQGVEQWSKPILTPKSLYGMSTSPVVSDDLLILVLDNDENLPNSRVSRSKIVAYNKFTGSIVWEALRPFHRSGWSTPTIWTHAGERDLVVLGNGRLRGYDLATGEEKWSISGFSRETIARPIVGDQHVFASASMLGGVADEHPDPEPFWEAVMRFDANRDGRLEPKEMTEGFTFPFRPHLPVGHPGFGLPLPQDEARRQTRLNSIFSRTDRNHDGFWTRGEFLEGISFNRTSPNLVAIRPGGNGNIAETHVDWSLHRGIPEIPTPVYYQGRIYLLCDGGILSSVDAANGRTIYRKRLGPAGHYRASPVIGNGHLYAISERGELSVIKTGDTFELVCQQAFGEPVGATPALDSNTIYIRTGKRLYAFTNSRAD